MKQVTLNIPDGKFDFFMKVFKQMGLDIADKNIDIPKWQQELTLKRLEELDKDPSKAIDFNTMIDGLEQKYEL
jgi:hypothetical protein